MATAASNHLGGLRLALIRLRNLGLELPIEVWLEPGLDPGFGWPKEVTFQHFLDACTVGFARKNEALLRTNFDEVLYLDADIWFLVNPESWFESERFQDLGHLIWPDLPGVNSVGWPPTDSGVMLWDLQRHRAWLESALKVTLAEHDGRAEGDKESYALAHGEPLVHVAPPPDFAGFVETEEGESLVRGCAMLHYWQETPAFLHSTLFKFGVHECFHEPPHWPWRFSSSGGWDHAFSNTYGRWFPTITLDRAHPMDRV